MALSTYTGLTDSIATWLDRTDLTSVIPDFVIMGEAYLNRKLRTREMLTRNDAFTVDSRYETVPTDFAGVKQFVLQRTPVVNLDSITPDMIVQQRQRYTSSGIPIYYSVIGSSFEFLPTPNDTFTATLLYYQRLPALVTNTTNWLLDAHPDLYLWASLLAAEPYIHNDERIATWKMQLDSGIAALNMVDQRESRGPTPMTRGRSL
jgi:hypothetical protein